MAGSGCRQGFIPLTDLLQTTRNPLMSAMPNRAFCHPPPRLHPPQQDARPDPGPNPTENQPVTPEAAAKVPPDDADRMLLPVPPAPSWGGTISSSPAWGLVLGNACIGLAMAPSAFTSLTFNCPRMPVLRRSARISPGFTLAGIRT